MSLDLLAYYGLAAEDNVASASEPAGNAPEPQTVPQPVAQQGSSQLPPIAVSPASRLSPWASNHDGDPYNIDGKDFDAKLFLEREFRSKGVNELVDLNHEVSTAKRSLDNEIKLLVYENYSKFIKATDMIKDMKENVENMENDMIIVEKQMEAIQSNALNLEQSFGPNRNKVDNLVGVSRLLNRLEFLFELPGRLRRCIAVGADAQAVRYYRTASRILQRYRNVKSFERIRTESESIATGLRQALRARVQDVDNLSAADQIDVASMLIDLQEPEEQLLADIFGARRRRLLDELETTRVQLASQPELMADRAVGMLHVGFVESLILFAGSFMEGFVRSRHVSSPVNARAFSDPGKGDESVALRCHNALVRFVEEMLEPYFEDARRCLVARSLRQFPLDRSEAETAGVPEQESVVAPRAAHGAHISRAVQAFVTALEAFQESLQGLRTVLQDPLSSQQPAIHAALQTIQRRVSGLMHEALERCALQVFLHAESQQAGVLVRLYSGTSPAPPAAVSAELFAVAAEALELLQPLIRLQQVVSESRGDSGDLLGNFAGRMLQSWGSLLLFHCHHQGHRLHGRRQPDSGAWHRCTFLRLSQAPVFPCNSQTARPDASVDLLPPVPKDAFVEAAELRAPAQSFSGKPLFQSPAGLASAATAGGGQEEHKQAPVEPMPACNSMSRLMELVDTSPPLVFLVLSRVASEFARTQIDGFLGLVRGQQETAVVSPILKTRIPAMIALASEASQMLLRAYVERHAELLSAVLHRSWVSVEKTLVSPSEVSGPVLRFWEQLQAGVVKELAQFLPAPPNYRPAVSFRGASHSGSSSMGYGRLESDIGKLFKQRVAVFDEVPATRHAPLVAVLKIVFKDFLENLRLRRLDLWGLLQLQIDNLMSRQFVLHLLSESDSEVLTQLLDEVLSSAASRSFRAPGANQIGIAETVCSQYIHSLPMV